MPPFSFPLFFTPHLFFLFLLSLSAATHAVFARYTSVFSFGDSLIDTGNYFHIDDSAPTGRFPYGITFFHRPTGRCSDGRVALDFIAEALGIPFLPPYLASHSDAQQLRHGANFAVAGATVLPADFFIEQKIEEGVLANASLGNQIGWFLDLFPSLCNSPSVCGNSLSETFFLVGEIGVNDYFLLFTNGWRLEEIWTFVPQVVSTVTSAVDTLIKYGATTVVVPGVVPLGCMAILLTLGESSDKKDYEAQTGCLKNWNELCQYHNHLLKIQLNRLRDIHPHATIIYSDYYNAVWQVFPSPQQFGELFIFSHPSIHRHCSPLVREANQQINPPTILLPFHTFPLVHLNEEAREASVEFDHGFVVGLQGLARELCQHAAEVEALTTTTLLLHVVGMVHEPAAIRSCFGIGMASTQRRADIDCLLMLWSANCSHFFPALANE
ncbi:hypothetical protein ACLOJK_009382 [Asimina triloba]